MENEIDKQEREIIESLEREEKEHKKYLESISSGTGCPKKQIFLLRFDQSSEKRH